MKSLLLILALTLAAAAQCETDPMPYPKGGALASETIKISGAEGSIRLDASSFKTSWTKRGSEAAVVTVFVDGKYHQDVVLFIGEEDLPTAKPRRHSYDLFLGELPKGEHKIEIFLNTKRSAQNANHVAVHDLRLGWSQPNDYEMMRNVPKTSPQYSTFKRFRARSLARANSPFLFARPNSVDKFTDIPLLTYYELFDEPDDVVRVRYTTIFSNEDGGTQSKALMARWGRTVDIEWVYEMRIDRNGKIFDETYQAANHETKKFTGKREFGSHPVLYIATDNNNFSDTGCSSLRFAQEAIEVDLSNGSRETLMEKYPWIYRVMAEEVIREGRVDRNSAAPNVIGDPREYVYAELYNQPRAATVSLEVLTLDGRKFFSDLGDESLRVARTGYFRVAVLAPPEIDPQKFKSYVVRCHAAGSTPDSACENVRLVKVVRLNEDFTPIELKLDYPARTIKAGESVVFSR